MTNNTKLHCDIKSALLRFAALLLTLLVVISAAFAGTAGFSLAESKESEPIRSAHKVKVGEKKYCCFVTDNVILSPKDIKETEDAAVEAVSKDGEELTDEARNAAIDDAITAMVLEKAGFYMKEPNCTESSHSAITAEDWNKDKGSILLGEEDIAAIRGASTADGAPVKLYMDLQLTTEKAEEITEDTKMYSTGTLTGPALLFVAVATESDIEKAEKDEAACEAKKEESKTEPAAEEQPQAAAPAVKKPKAPKATAPEETLPEFKTIKMLDRSGGPLEETLKEGDPVTLEWRALRRNASNRNSSFLSRIPGGALSLAAIAAAGAAAIYVIVRRKKEQEDE